MFYQKIHYIYLASDIPHHFQPLSYFYQMLTRVSSVQHLCYTAEFHSCIFFLMERISKGTTKQYRDGYIKLICDVCMYERIFPSQELKVGSPVPVVVADFCSLSSLSSSHFYGLSNSSHGPSQAVSKEVLVLNRQVEALSVLLTNL